MKKKNDKEYELKPEFVEKMKEIEKQAISMNKYLKKERKLSVEEIIKSKTIDPGDTITINEKILLFIGNKNKFKQVILEQLSTETLIKEFIKRYNELDEKYYDLLDKINGE